MNAAAVVAIAIPALIVIWWLTTFNRLVRLKNHLKESWSDVDVELKRRHELIPNLVATVKGYAAHESAVFERVTELRARAMVPHAATSERAADESALGRALQQVFAVAEGYPRLKSDAHFLALQKELSLTEDRIAAARRFFNGNVREMRSLCEMFPSSFIASSGDFEAPEFFELDSAAERSVPRVEV